MTQSITAQELHNRMNSQPETVILDVRAASAFQDWHISHQSSHIINIQTSKLKANGPEAYPEIPKDKPIVVVCAQGNASREAAEILTEHGYEAMDLENGMNAWSEFYYPVTVAKSSDFELIQVVRPAKGCLSYLLVSGQEAVVVDAARHTEYYEQLVSDKGVTLKHVLDTHCHADHISGGPVLANAAGANYWVTESEMPGATISFKPLTDGLEFQFGSASLKVLSIPTPGHTPGSTSFMVNDTYLLSGDTVFVSGLGRPDLGGKAEEWAKMLYDTVQSKLSHLDDNVLVLPAHFSGIEEVNSLGYVGSDFKAIREANDLLQGVGEAEFTKAVAGQTGLTPPNYDTIVQINRGLVSPTKQEATELEIGPNRCAVKHLA